MYETKQEYETLARDQAAILGWQIGHTIHHRDQGLCPRCGDEGHFDIEGLGFFASDTNSIYYSAVFYEWRCRHCDYRMCA